MRSTLVQTPMQSTLVINSKSGDDDDDDQQTENAFFGFAPNKYRILWKIQSVESAVPEHWAAYVCAVCGNCQVESQTSVWIFTLLLAVMHTHRRTLHTGTHTTGWLFKEDKIAEKSNITNVSIVERFLLGYTQMQRILCLSSPSSSSSSSSPCVHIMCAAQRHRGPENQKNKTNLMRTNQMTPKRDDTLAIK